MEAERAAAAGAAAPGSPGGELSAVLTTPARSRRRPACATASDPSKSWPSSHITSVCLSLPKGGAAGGNHGVRSRYTCTLLFHQVSRRGAGKRRERIERKGLYLMAHLRVSELLSVSEGRESALVPSSPVPPHMS